MCLTETTTFEIRLDGETAMWCLDCKRIEWWNWKNREEDYKLLKNKIPVEESVVLMGYLL